MLKQLIAVVKFARPPLSPFCIKCTPTRGDFALVLTVQESSVRLQQTQLNKLTFQLLVRSTRHHGNLHISHAAFVLDDLLQSNFNALFAFCGFFDCHTWRATKIQNRFL